MIPQCLVCDSADLGLPTVKDTNTQTHTETHAHVFKIQCFPGKIGLFEIISARIQPTDQISTVEWTSRSDTRCEARGKERLEDIITRDEQLTRFGVSFGVEHYLRSSVPPSGHILSEEASVIMLGVSDSS